MDRPTKLGLSSIPFIWIFERNMWGRMMDHRESTHLENTK